MILEAKFGQHLPLNRQSQTYVREGIGIDVSTMAGCVGACTATLAPLSALIQAHVMAAARVHGDDTTVPVLAKGKTVIGRLCRCEGCRPGRGCRPAAREAVGPRALHASLLWTLQRLCFGPN